jgi:endoglucanase Acf2
VSWKYLKDRSVSRMNISVYAFDLWTKTRQTNVLLALLPHMAQHLVSHASKFTTIAYNSPRGKLQLYKTRSYFVVEFPFSGVLPMIPIAVKDESTMTEIKKMMTFLSNLSTQYLITSTDSYWTGKVLQKVSDLAVISDQLSLYKERDIFLGAVTNVLENWFDANDLSADSQKASFFYYDPHAFTLIGHPSSFGSDIELNDHHFHYGYFIRTAAIIAMYDRQWAIKYSPLVELLIKDTANWDSSDSRFPLNRQFDHLSGFHYASGHASFGSGNNQESSSEAMNHNAALILWGSVMNHNDIMNLGIYLYSHEEAGILILIFLDLN